MVEDIRVALKDGMPWNTVTAIPLDRPLPTPAELVKAGRGYRLFYCGRSKLSESGMVMLATVDGGNRSLRLSMRNARCFLGDIWDTAGPDREYDFYLSVQPAPGGKSLFVDRLVLGRPKSGK